MLLFHARVIAPVRMTGGYLAVDLFFVLSGFVLAHAYERRLRQGMELREFFVLRMVRIYPLFLVGSTLGVLLGESSWVATLLIPNLATRALFPDNAAMWSLLFELIVNLAFAAVALRLNKRALVLILAVSGATLAFGTLNNGNADLGAFWNGSVYGVARCVFGFTLGVSLFRIRGARHAARRRTVLAWLLIPTLVTALAFSPAHRALWDLACIFAVLPGVVWLGAGWEAPRPRPMHWFGDISYPLYCIHLPVVELAVHDHTPFGWIAPGLLLSAFGLDRLDRRVRPWLLQRLRPINESAALSA